MIRQTLLAALFLSTLVGMAPSQSGPDFLAEGDTAQQLADLVEQMTENGFRGAVLAARDGEVLIARGRGDDDFDATTLFELASQTKQFTAAAILRLQEQRKLRLDTPISEYLPAVPDDCEKITVRHLLQNTSGIPKTNSRGGGTDLAAVVPMFLKGGPQHEPGTHFEYWNQGWALLAGIIERRSGMSYADYCRRELFRKAKMKTACFTGDKPPRRVHVAVGQSTRGDRSALEHPYGVYGYQYRGMGGAVCSVWDLWKWDRALAGGRILKSASLQQLFEPGLENYAMGWYVEERKGRLVQHHRVGGVRGFRAEFRRFPEQDACLIVLSATEDQPVARYADSLEQALFGEEAEIEAGTPDDIVALLVGRFESADGTWVEFAKNGPDLGMAIQAPEQPRPSQWVVVPGTDDGSLVCRSGEFEFALTVLARDESGRATKLSLAKWDDLVCVK